MSETISIMFDENGIAKVYDDTFDITIHCESEEEQNKVLEILNREEKTGRWIQQPRYDGDDQPDLVCPNCGFKISWWDMGNFCAKCGTGLEGGAG